MITKIKFFGKKWAKLPEWLNKAVTKDADFQERKEYSITIKKDFSFLCEKNSKGLTKMNELKEISIWFVIWYNGQIITAYGCNN